MSNEASWHDRFVILADESADWKIAGLRQLDRLLLSLNEYGLSTVVVWKPGTASTGGSNEFTLTESPARVVTSRLFLHRKALADFLDTAPPVHTPADFAGSANEWIQLADEFEKACRTAKVPDTGRRWQFLQSPAEIATAEKDFLRSSGKPQDGAVSKWINRPLTRPITHLLLKLPISPTAWTLSIFILPFLACLFLLRGNYWSIVIGTIIYQIYSMLDGCDGEIARAKFLESTRGGRVDDLCDIIGAFLFVIGLGVGLCRLQASWIYAAEGVLLAGLIALNEWALRTPSEEPNTAANAVQQAAYPRHRQLLQRVGLSGFGEKLAGIVLQATKRDVGILLFVFLALAGVPEWILHPWLLVTLMTLTLNVISFARARA